MNRALGLTCAALLHAAPGHAQDPGKVLSEWKLSSSAGNFGGTLANGDEFGTALDRVVDLNGDGLDEFAIGVSESNTGGTDQGSVWLLLSDPQANPGPNAFQIAEGVGGFAPVLTPGDLFGTALAPWTHAGGPALAVGAPGDDSGGSGAGAFWIVPVDDGGASAAPFTVGSNHPVFGNNVSVGDRVGSALADLGDLTGDGTRELAVGAPGDDLGGANRGAIWIVSLTAGGTPVSAHRIGTGAGGFGSGLANLDEFGTALAVLDDLDGDGRAELAVGAPGDNGGGLDAGAVWILFLDGNANVAQKQKIGEATGGFGGALDGGDRFGSALARSGVLHAEAVGALAVGTPGDDDGSSSQGAVWMTFLDDDGTVLDETKISETEGGFGGLLTLGDAFGAALVGTGDLNGDGKPDLAVGAIGDDDQGSDRGAVWWLHLDGFLPFEVTSYGCGFHPPESFTWIGGSASPGSTLTVAVDNPLGTQASGSLPFVLASLGPDPNFPCGTAIPGWGMAGMGQAGELLVQTSQLVLPVLGGDPWTPGVPAPVEVPIPMALGLLGERAYLQGLLYDPIAAAGVEVGLADALQLTFGP